MSFDAVIAAIDAGHSEDPRSTIAGPNEMQYAVSCTSYLDKLAPDASDLLRIAVRGQHFKRWEVPRDSYPMTKPGYFSWRTQLKARQGAMVAEIMKTHGYTDAQAARVNAIIRKENFKKDEEVQTLEDVACLVFLDKEFEAFNELHEEDKIIHILRKTWPKMSERGHQVALQIQMSSECSRVVQKALA